MRRSRCMLFAILLVLPAGVLAQSAKTARAPSADFIAPGPVVPLPAVVSSATSTVSAESLAAHIAFLAAPALEGRGLGRQGVEAAAEYVATSLALAGIRPPGATGAAPRAGYFQAVPIREITNIRGKLTVETRADGATRTHTFVSGTDCLFSEMPPQVIGGPVVFAGYGIRDPSLGRDDYGGIDVRDKMVLVIAGLPPGAEWQKPELISRYAARGPDRYSVKFETARSLGARGVLVAEPAEFGAVLASRPPASVPYFHSTEAASPAVPPLVPIAPAVARALLGSRNPASSWLASGPSRALPGVTVTLRVAADERPIFGRNVVGVVPGSDPKRREEAVVLGAHVDHLGRVGGKLYPGADDNASGVAALLEIAKAYAASPVKPRRTVVFAFWTGEEAGHLGSDYYVRHPAWPLERTVVYANLDMIAHPWSAEEIRKLVAEKALVNGEGFLASVKAADFIEPGVAEWAPELCPVLERAAQGLGLALHLDRTDGKSGGSDYRAFARRGVRFIRFFGNYFAGYHEPSDTPETADPGQVLKMARLALATTWMLADM